MNVYGNLKAVWDALKVSAADATRDAQLMRVAPAISREIDRRCNRHFYTATATKRFDGPPRGDLLIPDLLTVATFKADTDGDGAFDDETWVEGTDFHLEPYDGFPKLRLATARNGSFGLSQAKRVYEIAGIWGYGDGQRELPWDDVGLTVTIGAADPGDPPVKTGTVSAAGLEPGDTLLVDEEQIYIEAMSSATAISKCARGVNGTTALGAGYTTEALYRAAYPSDIVWLAAAMTARAWRMAGAGLTFKSRTIGNYSETLWDQPQQEEAVSRAIHAYVRAGAF